METMGKLLTYSTSYAGTGAYQKMNLSRSVTKLESAALQRVQIALLDHRREIAAKLRTLDPENKGVVKAIDWAKAMNETVPLRLPWLHLKHKFVEPVPGDDSSVQYSSLLVKLEGAFAKHGDSEFRENLYRMRDEFSKLFRILDTDGSGLLDRGEFVKGCDLINSMKAQQVFDPSDVDKFMKQLDVNGDGKISFVEFTEGLMSHDRSSSSEPSESERHLGGDDSSPHVAAADDHLDGAK
ncbi:hypothetical protein CTAYLR_008438 [Chrysophaeum taylorii]|uniref:EF-hand domain-containing protein n=1 Tax=Chrysophaeum taylorii TaxID=2483200 RepID=A0AAD7XQ16_9STRA|nr:hypothetical protein CTAYLR_008438 [Chrysophaeum taylorii]